MNDFLSESSNPEHTMPEIVKQRRLFCALLAKEKDDITKGTAPDELFSLRICRLLSEGD